ncbi:hypothetical protein [Staphylococcus equorum]|uniref:hypothetical protein n=1 Tax=Staphylococcus equorum TaxID=246432 RepID=UPI0008530FDC|nr:hypothetical protein [Staphylococcus equorum]OEK60634.1 hypothetical protein ASS99_11265 [Staphylococcus equorum]
MNESNYKVFRVTFRLGSGQKLVYKVTARSVDEAQGDLVKHLKRRELKYVSVHCIALSEAPLVPTTTYID